MISLAFEWAQLAPDWGTVLSWTLYVVAFVCYLVGLFGCVLPYPGHLIILCGFAAWAFGSEADYSSVVMWVSLSLLAIFGGFVDNIFAVLGAKRFGCSKPALWCSALGFFIGAFFFPYGLFIGPFLGAFLAEVFFARRGMGASTKSGVGAMLGSLAGMAAKFVVAGIMFIVFYI